MAKSIFDLPEFKPFSRRWEQRSALFALRRAYYDGSIYGKRMAASLGWLAPRLYGSIKPLFLPLARAVDVDAGIVPGGWTWEADTPDPVRLARQRLFDWSDWDTDGVLLVHYGAVFGQSGLKVVDLREQGRVLLVPISPEMYMLVESGQYDSTPRMALWIEEREGDDGPEEYAEVIEAERIRTFVDGEPVGVDGREPEYRNELGFVPFVECYHMRTGHRAGEPTFEKALPLLDEVNGLASYLAEIIKKHAEPQWAIFGAEPSELTHSGDNVWFIPGQGDAKILVPDLDIDGVLKFVEAIRSNVHGALPELAFDELRGKDQIATATIELQLLELVLKIKRIRPNYDDALITALQMAGRAARSMGLAELAVLDDEGLAFDNERPVLPVTRLDEIRLAEAELALAAQQQIFEGGALTATAGVISEVVRA